MAELEFYQMRVRYLTPHTPTKSTITLYPYTSFSICYVYDSTVCLINFLLVIFTIVISLFIYKFIIFLFTYKYL